MSAGRPEAADVVRAFDTDEVAAEPVVATGAPRPEHVAWVLVDLQRAFARAETVELAKAVYRAVQERPGKTFALVQENPLDGPLRNLRDWHGACGPHDATLLEPLWKLGPEVFPKTGYGALCPLPFDELRSFHAVYLAGADTDACVLATAFALFDAGVPVVVRADLCTSAGGPQMHAAALAILRRQLGCGRVINDGGKNESPNVSRS